jgi:hypothetical protein
MKGAGIIRRPLESNRHMGNPRRMTVRLQRLLPILALATAAMASAQNPPTPVKPPSMIVHNPDGTFTVRKEPASSTKDTRAENGLVIPAQVVVPIISDRKHREPPR